MAQRLDPAEQAGITFHPRGRAETEALFAGTDLVEPGVVPVVSRHPDADVDAESAWYWAGTGREP
ncbi:SAM-dependent methyltransferase [Nocardia brasiliensis]|uniref:SAM-dependent methyltransferase n=1 Tax=Nocardia brasiliensis TaxID=37326 RepID=UPI0024548905|nr:SAM-dependent methyltransferase [Nocardia brasiliensis]